MGLERDEYIKFADDICLMYVPDELDALVSQVNERLWCRFNKFSLNPNNSEIMVITHK